MKLKIRIGYGYIKDSDYTAYLFAVNENDIYIYDGMASLYDIADSTEACRLPTKFEILNFIKEVREEFPGVEIEDGTGVLAQ